MIPPPTPPLSRPFIGYGVIDVSYTHVVAEPNQAGFSLGYLRKGSVVEVLERRQVTHGGIVESWVFVSGIYQGWLKEDVIQVYDNPAQAQTASASMTK
jgi:mannose-6-phosphate isomerase-like protein (cupin superfamily)